MSTAATSIAPCWPRHVHYCSVFAVPSTPRSHRGPQQPAGAALAQQPEAAGGAGGAGGAAGAQRGRGARTGRPSHHSCQASKRELGVLEGSAARRRCVYTCTCGAYKTAHVLLLVPHCPPTLFPTPSTVCYTVCRPWWMRPGSCTPASWRLHRLTMAAAPPPLQVQPQLVLRLVQR